MAFSIVLFASSALANPVGGEIVGGAATIVGQGTAQVTVQQTTNRAVIHWDDFSIAAGEQTTFVQPSADSVILNRVTGGNPSEIFGALQANGTVILSNKNGVLIGKEGSVNAGSFIATSHDVSSDSFMAGGVLSFSGEGGNGPVVNEGSINIHKAGLAALVAPAVRNSGIIVANLGQVVLGAATGFTLDFYGDDLIRFSVSDALSETLRDQTGTPLKALVDQSGSIKAAGGKVVLSAALAREVVNQAVHVSGTVSVDHVEQKGGTIILSASTGAKESSGAIVVGQGSRLSAQGKTGGLVSVSAQTITIEKEANINADGSLGGGQIYVGGFYQGIGSLLHAQQTIVENGSSLSARANEKGNGGEIIIWSDLYTKMDGVLSVRGGDYSGDGGLVETSSKGVLSLSGRVDASTTYGTAGLWLLDPNNITIRSGADVNVSGSPDYVSTNDSAYVSTESLVAALNAGTSVTVTTTAAGSNAEDGNITVSSSIIKTTGGDATLTLKASNKILVDQNVEISSTSGALDVVLWSDADASGVGMVKLSSATILTNGGDLIIGGGLDDGANGGVAGDGRPDGYAFGDTTEKFGVYIRSSHLSTDAGTILVRGQGVADSSLTSEFGVAFSLGSFMETTTGDVSLYGIGGNGANWGVGLNLSAGEIQTVDGALYFYGKGGTGGPSSYGINVQSHITSTGTGTITLYGDGTVGVGSFGVMLDGARVTSTIGDIVITGNSIGGYNAVQLVSLGSANITFSSHGTISFTPNAGAAFVLGGDSMTGDIVLRMRGLSTLLGTLSIKTAGSLSIIPDVSSYSIAVGVETSASNITLRPSFLSSIEKASAVIIGDSVSGSGVVTFSGWDLRGHSYDLYVYGGSVSFNANDVLWNGDNNLSFIANTGNVTVSGRFIKSGGGAASLLLKAAGTVSLLEDIISTAGALGLIVWADSDANHIGGVKVFSSIITTNGGDLVMAGGLDDGANGGTAGDGIPDDYAYGGIVGASGVGLAGGSMISTAGGSILMRGHGWIEADPNNSISGVFIGSASGLYTTSGSIDLWGIGGNGNGFNCGINLTGSGGSSFVQTEKGAITITGVGTIGSGTNNYGISVSFGSVARSTGSGAAVGLVKLVGTGAGSSSAGIMLQSNGAITTADANIYIQGTGGEISGNGVSSYHGSIYRSTGRGNITLTGTAMSGTGVSLGGYVGYVDLIEANTGNIYFLVDTIGATAGVSGLEQITTNGSVYIVPISPETTIRVGSGSGALYLSTYFLEGITAGEKLVIGDSLSGTGLVKVGAWDMSGKTYDLEIYGGSISTVGTIDIELGDHNVTLVSLVGDTALGVNMTKSSGGDKTLLVKAAGSISENTSILSTSGALNVILWSDSDADHDGSLRILGGSLVTNNGRLYMAGGLDNGANDGVAGDGLPDGYAWGNLTRGYGVELNNTLITLGTGSFFARGHGYENNTLNAHYGIWVHAGAQIVTTTGDQTYIGQGGLSSVSGLGIYLFDAPSKIETETGSITIKGTAASNEVSANRGVQLSTGFVVASTGTGSSVGGITITGTTASAGVNNDGIFLHDNSFIRSVDADIVITGTSIASGNAINSYLGCSILSTGSGDLTLTALVGVLRLGTGNVVIGGASAQGAISLVSDIISGFAADTVVQTNGKIYIVSVSAGRSIGINGGFGDLSLSSLVIASLQAGGGVVIGGETAGAINAAATSWALSVNLKSAGLVSLSGAQTMGSHSFTIEASDILLSGGSISSTASGDAVVLAARTWFRNNTGSTAISTPNGRWLVYSSAPAANSFGSLNSGNSAVWATAYGDMLSASGNRYVFTYAPTLVVSSINYVKDYGVDAQTLIQSSYKITGLSVGVLGAFLGDSLASVLNGQPVLSSLGAWAGARAVGSPYRLVLSQGSMIVGGGYQLSLLSSGRLIVNALPTASMNNIVETLSFSNADGNVKIVQEVGFPPILGSSRSSSSLKEKPQSGKYVPFICIHQGSASSCFATGG